MKSKKYGSKFAGKGYYIALILCAAAIGISGYLYYRNDTVNDPQMQNPSASVNPSDKDDDDVQAIAPGPSDGNDPVTPPVNNDKPGTDKVLRTCAPVTGQTVMGYAMDCLSYNPTTRDWRVHNGIDIAAPEGTAVCAAADGTVYTVYEDETMGTTVVIRHENGYVTKYASLASEVSVAPGDEVSMGQTIGTVGNTALLEYAIGEHVHFSVTLNDEAVDPLDFFALG